jgi:hypothetical protein
MTWDPTNVIIYSVILRWLPEGADRYERDAEYDQAKEHWLTYSMAKKAAGTMASRHVPPESEWWSVEILLTHPDTHNPERRLYTKDNDGKEWDWEDE